MKLVLPDDYDIDVANMIPMTEDQLKKGWVLEEADFYSFKLGKEVEMPILQTEDEEHQIFQMKDGRFILEVEILDEGDVEYFYSENLEDLL